MREYRSRWWRQLYLSLRHSRFFIFHGEHDGLILCGLFGLGLLVISVVIGRVFF